MKAYFDNGATTKLDPKVLKRMEPYFTEKYGNASSMHDFGLEARKALKKSRETIARKINASPKEVIFTSGGTESNNMAIRGAALANKSKGNRIITSKIEHPSVLNTFASLEEEGFEAVYVGVDEHGFVDLEELEKAINNKTILISIMHANNEIGTIQPIVKIGKIAKENNIIFHTDAVQSFTKEDIDVDKMGIGLASFSSHKIHGPKGVGALYVRAGVEIEPIMHGGGHEFGKRSGTENVSGIVGFAHAAQIHKETHNKKMKGLRDHIIESILEIPGTMLNGPKKGRLVNNINISFKIIEGESILMLLNKKGIAVSTGSACSSKKLEPSHVISAINVPVKYEQGSIRITLSRFNTKKQADYLIKELGEAVKKLREMSPYGL